MNEMTAKGHHKWVIELDDDRWFHGKKKSSIEYDFYPLQRLIREGRVALDGDAKAFIKEQMKPGDSELEEDVSEMEEDSTDNELGEITANVENDIDMSIEAPNGDGRPGITYINSDSGFGFRRWYRAFTKKSIDAWKVEQNPKGGDMAHCWGAKVDLNTFGELKPGKKFRWVLYKRQYFLNFKKITVRRNGESFKSSKFPIIQGSN